MHMHLQPRMLNLYARPHGGAIYALADAAFSVIANNSNNISVALDCAITYHNSPDPGILLEVEGELLATTRKTGSYLFKIFGITDAKKILVATMKSTVYRTGKPIDPNIPQ
jgi:acyl-CoA thioesterase